MRKAIILWVLGSAVGYVLQCGLGEWGILSLEMLPLADSDSPMHEAIRRGPGILLVPATPFFHGGAFHAFLGCISLLASGRLVEQACGTRFTFFLLGAASILGSGAAWLVEGDPSFGASAPFFGLLGGLTILVTRKIFPPPLVWNLSFPLLILAGLFSLAAEEMQDVSHLAHLVAFLLGMGMVYVIPKRIVPTKVMAIVLGGVLTLGCGLAGIGGVRIARDRGVDLGLAALLDGFTGKSPFAQYEDPEGRFRMAYPMVSEPVPSGDGLVLRMKGSEDNRLLTLEIDRRTSGGALDVVAREVIEEYRKGLGGVVREDSIAILEEGPLSLGPWEGWKTVISSSISEGARTDIVVVALTEDYRYTLISAYLDRDVHGEAWILRCIDSLEILE